MCYLSDKLLDQLQEDTGLKFTLCSRLKMQKSVRNYFIQIHNEAVQSTVIATNKKQFTQPQFHDK